MVALVDFVHVDVVNDPANEIGHVEYDEPFGEKYHHVRGSNCVV